MQLLSHILVEKLKSIVLSETSKFTLTKSLQEFCKDYNLGTTKGKTVLFSDDHKLQIRKLLVIKGHEIDASIKASMSRTEKLEFGPNEKAGGGRIKNNRISIKAYADLPLMINRNCIQLPKNSHLNISISQILDCQHNCIVVVENYENFNRFDETKILLPEAFNNPLVIYRGDKSESRLDGVLAFIESYDLPVLAAVDLDPFGLVNVAKIKNLKAVLAPNEEDLNRLFETKKACRPDLYEKHYLGCHNSLDSLMTEHPCHKLWKIIKEKKAGIVQEQFLRLNSILILWHA